MSSNVKQAIILLGHGSRVPDAGSAMETVAERLREQAAYDIVETCYMSRLGPRISEAMKKCAEQGATRIILIPYFLHGGIHTIIDIPSTMKEEAERYPDINIIYGKNLGFDDVLIDLVKKRVEESSAYLDIRDVDLPPRENFPLPAGQKEFVAMSPDDAQKFMAGGGHHHHDHDH